VEGSTHAPVRYAVCLLMTLLALEGCARAGGGAGGGQVPPPSAPAPTRTTTAEPTHTPRPTTPPHPTVSPARQEDHTVAGGAAFIRAYFAELNRAYQVPASDGLARLSAGDCGFCKKNLARIRTLKAAQERYASDLVAITAPQAFGAPPRSQQYYQLTLSELGAARVDASGRVLARDDRGSGVVNTVLRWSSQGWVLLGVEGT
jgi:hypothetical protein